MYYNYTFQIYHFEKHHNNIYLYLHVLIELCVNIELDSKEKAQTIKDIL
jgi:hypothetical protein